MTETRFIVIAGCVSFIHIIASVILFTMTLGGIGAMTAGESQASVTAWDGFTVLNCGPIAANQFLKYHIYSPRPKNVGGPGWTQDDQTELGRRVENQNSMKYALFFVWPFLVGLIVASIDLVFQRFRPGDKNQRRS